MNRPNRKDYINKKTSNELIADLELYINYLENKPSNESNLPLHDVIDSELANGDKIVAGGRNYTIDDVEWDIGGDLVGVITEDGTSTLISKTLISHYQ